MGIVSASAIVVGTILGTSIFVQPSEITRLVPNVPVTIAAWLAAGLLTLCGAMVCAELGSAFPDTGGVYIFLNHGISRWAGFLWGWAMFWCMHSGIIAAIAVIVARYVAFFVPLGDAGIRAVAIAGILGLSAINYLGVRQGSAVQVVLTVAKVLAIALIFVFVFAFAPSMAHSSAMPSGVIPSAPGPLSLLRNFLLAVAAGLFAYGGWHMVTYTAGETREAQRTIPRSLWIGILVVTLCYLSLNAAYFRVLPISQIVASPRVAADAALALAGRSGATIISLLVVISGLGSLNGIILAGPRVYYAMSRDGLVFRWLGAIHSVRRTPYAAILAQAAMASVLVATGTYRALFTRVVNTEWLFFALMTFGLFRLHKRAAEKGYAPSFRSWGYPVVPALFIAVCAAVLASQFADRPRDSFLGLCIVLSGLPVYYLWAKKSGRKGTA
jgi:basic amino acid/polyamine antiporter, APA family